MHKFDYWEKLGLLKKIKKAENLDKLSAFVFHFFLCINLISYNSVVISLQIFQFN